MAVLICNTISTGSWSSPQGNDSRQMIIKNGGWGGWKWDVITAAKISLIKVMSSLQRCLAGVLTLATAKSSKETGVMPWSKQDEFQSYRLVCLLIVLLLSLMNRSLCREHSNISLVPYSVPSLLHSIHGKMLNVFRTCLTPVTQIRFYYYSVHHNTLSQSWSYWCNKIWKDI